MSLIDLLRTDGGVMLAGLALLIGWLTGAGFIVALFWRNLTRPIDGAVLILRRDYYDALARLGEATRQVEEQQRTIDHQTEQIGQLYKDVDRMARLACDEAMKRKGA